MFEQSDQPNLANSPNQELHPRLAVAKKPFFKLPSLRANKKPALAIALTVTIILAFLSFALWFFLTVGPILWVETRYQFKTFLQEKLHISNLAQLFIPNFSGLDLKGRSKYKEYGIDIPRIFLDEPVVFNVDPNDKQAYTEALKKGIAQASSTRFPNSGGLGYYFAHSSTPELKTQYNAIFYLLGKLEKGDDIYIWHEGQKNHYQVTEKQTTAPSYTQFLYSEPTKETIVLQTCWPPGTTKQRMLIFAERVEE